MTRYVTFLFIVVIDLVNEFSREVVLSEALYADNFVLMYETM